MRRRPLRRSSSPRRRSPPARRTAATRRHRASACRPPPARSASRRPRASAAATEHLPPQKASHRLERALRLLAVRAVPAAGQHEEPPRSPHSGRPPPRPAGASRTGRPPPGSRAPAPRCAAAPPRCSSAGIPRSSHDGRSSRGRSRPRRVAWCRASAPRRSPRSKARAADSIVRRHGSSTKTCGASRRSPRASGTAPGRGRDQRDRGAVALADEDRLGDAELLEDPGQARPSASSCRNRTGPRERRRGPSLRSRAGCRRARRSPTAAARRCRKVAPRRDRAQALVEEDERRRLARPRAVPGVLQPVIAEVEELLRQERRPATDRALALARRRRARAPRRRSRASGTSGSFP